MGIYGVWGVGLGLPKTRGTILGVPIIRIIWVYVGVPLFRETTIQGS